MIQRCNLVYGSHSVTASLDELTCIASGVMRHENVKGFFYTLCVLLTMCARNHTTIVELFTVTNEWTTRTIVGRKIVCLAVHKPADR